MSTLKKLLALSLALAMVLALPVFASTYTESKYKDAANINAKCEEAIELVSVLNIMQGDDKGNFNPNGFITRAEVAKMIYVITNYGNDDKGVNYKNGNLFTDVAGHWAEGYINYAGMTKLVQGYGNGKFGPDDPITTAEVAKMLLTTIGYSAEVRGYTGAGWDKNVLSDATIIGLLSGYDYSTVGYAPRQWVAVMFANAMYALTYENMSAMPYTGMLTSTSGLGAMATEIVTMMEKYFGVDCIDTAVAIATDSAVIDGQAPAAPGKVKFAFDKTTADFSGSNLGAADLGQAYRLYVRGNKVLGKTCLSATYEARILDVETTINNKISANLAADKYVFDFNGTKLTFAAKEINALETGANEHTDVEYFEEVTPVDLYQGTLGNANRIGNRVFVGNETVKAIDTDDNGKIDYLFIVNYGYAMITKAGNHKEYGDYVYAVFSSNSEDAFDEGLYYNGEDRLYIDSCIITDDTLAKGEIVRVTWDLDNWAYVMEVLPMREAVEFEEINNKKLTYTFGGEEYQVATLGGVDWDLLVKKLLGNDFDLVYDGDLLVYIQLTDDTNKTLDAINNKIVLVLDADDEYSHNTIREELAIEYMTIDGETHIGVYDNDYALNKGGVDFDDLLLLSQDDDKNGGDYTVEGRLFRIVTVGRKVVLFDIDADTMNDDFNVSRAVADGYEELEDVELDATRSTKILDDYVLVNDNVYFYGYSKKGAEPTAKNTVYGVIKASDLGKGDCEEAYAQVFTKSNGYRMPAAVAGYIFANLDGAKSGDWLIVRSEPRTNKNGTYVKVEFSDGSTDTIYINSIGLYGYEDAPVEFELFENEFCYYIYNAIEKTYDLQVVPADSLPWAIVDYDEDSYEVCFANLMDDDDYEWVGLTKDTVIAVSEVTLKHGLNIENEEMLELYALEHLDTTQFVERKDLDRDTIRFIGEEDEGYTQVSMFFYDEEKDVLYVIVIHVMNTYNGYLPF